MKKFEKIFSHYLIDDNCGLFDEYIENNSLDFFYNILNRLERNINSTNGHEENNRLLVLLSYVYPGNIKEEELVFVKAAELFNIFMKNIEENSQVKILETNNYYHNIYLFIDYFFHNLEFIDYLNSFNKKEFVKSLVYLTKINYNTTEQSNISLSLLYSVSILRSFKKKDIEKYKSFFLNHFDQGVVEEFNECFT